MHDDENFCQHRLKSYKNKWEPYNQQMDRLVWCYWPNTKYFTVNWQFLTWLTLILGFLEEIKSRWQKGNFLFFRKHNAEVPILSYAIIRVVIVSTTAVAGYVLLLLLCLCLALRIRGRPRCFPWSCATLLTVSCRVRCPAGCHHSM